MRYSLILGLIALSLTCSTRLVAEDAASPKERLGPLPMDQREAARGRAITLPQVQTDAYKFSRSGERTLMLQPRIIGGVPAPIGAYPWQISIGLADVPPSLGHFCGGSVIGKNWILTAAHCVDGSTAPNTLNVQYGTNILSQGGKSAKVVKIIVHDNWDKASFDYDAALLKTDSALETTPIKLLTKDAASKIFPVGVLGMVSGWGLTQEGGSISDVLQHVGVQVKSNDDCNSPTAYSGQITDRMVCAGFATGGKDSCQGDSGGPFVIFDRHGGFALAGIVSWGEGCAKPNKFGVYTRVTEIADWVKQHVQ
jgi:transmembrane serine protease 9